MGTVIQSFKKVINHALTSRAAGASIGHPLVTGVDSVAAGQTGPTDTNVPTGSVIRFVEVQYSWTNLVSVSHIINGMIQFQRSGSAIVDPILVGGNPNRNQIMNQFMRSVGQNQNGNITIRVKVPSIYQRIREGDVWTLVTNATQVYSDQVQAIFKFYR